MTQPVEPHRETPPTSTFSASGVLFYGYRYYAPGLGRWPHRDPYEENGGMNLYAAMNNDIITIADVLGLFGLSGHIKVSVSGGIETITVTKVAITVAAKEYCGISSSTLSIKGYLKSASTGWPSSDTHAWLSPIPDPSWNRIVVAGAAALKYVIKAEVTGTKPPCCDSPVTESQTWAVNVAIPAVSVDTDFTGASGADPDPLPFSP